jgi:hypothetical protein
MVLLRALAIICVVWAVVASIMITADLKRRGRSINYLWLRIMILKYLHEYATITRDETGRVGPLFYHYVVPLNVALVLALVTGVLAR